MWILPRWLTAVFTVNEAHEISSKKRAQASGDLRRVAASVLESSDDSQEQRTIQAITGIAKHIND